MQSVGSMITLHGHNSYMQTGDFAEGLHLVASQVCHTGHHWEFAVRSA